jgi:hypothetical protein
MKKLMALFVLLMPVLAVGQNAINGTWQVAEHKWQLDQKPIVYELNDGMYSCMSCSPKFTVKADGTDQKVTGDPEMDTASITVVDPNTIDVVEKKDGKVAYHAMVTISSDGKTMTRKIERYSTEGVKRAYTVTLARASEAGTGAHSVSGSWTAQKIESTEPLTLSFKSTGDTLSFKGSDGEAYEAKFDGKDYPFQGERGTNTVSLKRIDDTTFEETYKDANGNVVWVSKISISPDGKTLTQVGQDKRVGRTSTFEAEKQENQEAEK